MPWKTFRKNKKIMPKTIKGHAASHSPYRTFDPIAPLQEFLTKAETVAKQQWLEIGVEAEGSSSTARRISNILDPRRRNREGQSRTQVALSPRSLLYLAGADLHLACIRKSH